MLKELAKQGLRKAGVNVTDIERLGVEPLLDLARLTHADPLATIFDIGANFGQTAAELAGTFPQARIFSFEPVPATFAAMQKNVAALAHVRPVQSAMGAQVGTAVINVTDDAGKNSLNAVQREATGVEVPVNTVDAFAEENQIQTIDLLKIDVEGFELQVLQGAARMFREKRVRYVFAECVFSPDTETPHTNFFDLHPILDAAGFCFFNCYAESFNLKIGCAMGNVLYALRERLPQQVPGRVGNIF